MAQILILNGKDTLKNPIVLHKIWYIKILSLNSNRGLFSDDRQI